MIVHNNSVHLCPWFWIVVDFNGTDNPKTQWKLDGKSV